MKYFTNIVVLKKLGKIFQRPGRSWVSEELYSGDHFLHAYYFHRVDIPLYFKPNTYLTKPFQKNRNGKAKEIPITALDG